MKIGYCPKCRMEREFEVRRVRRKVEVKGITINAKIEEARCSKCKHYIHNEYVESRNDEVIFTKYNKIANRKELDLIKIYPDRAANDVVRIFTHNIERAAIGTYKEDPVGQLRKSEVILKKVIREVGNYATGKKDLGLYFSGGLVKDRLRDLLGEVKDQIEEILSEDTSGE